MPATASPRSHRRSYEASQACAPRVIRSIQMDLAPRAQGRTADLLTGDVRQVHDLAAVILGDDRTLRVDFDFGRRYELAFAGSCPADLQHDQSEIEAGLGRRVRQPRP